MNLGEQYTRQFELRSWQEIFDSLPEVRASLVLDLGCAIGDQSAELVARGARVIGLDADEALLATAAARGLANAEFRRADLRAPIELETRVDGIWASFTAAYFPDLTPRLEEWKRHLKPGGWIALTEIDDLFGHQPMSSETQLTLDSFASEALTSGRYDFRMGRKLSSHLESAGFTVQRLVSVPDRELSFEGAAEPKVLAAWIARLERMASLQRFCGADFPKVRAELLGALSSAEHRSKAVVYSCLARL